MNAETLEIAKTAVRHYAETHPRPCAVSQRQAAEMLGCSPATVSRLCKAGKLRVNAVGQIPIADVDRALGAP